MKKKKNLLNNYLTDNLEIMNHISYYFFAIELLESKDKNYGIEVKSNSKHSLLPSFKYIYNKICDTYSDDNPKISSIKDGLQYWIKNLDKNYSKKSKYFKVPEILREDDFPELKKGFRKMD